MSIKLFNGYKLNKMSLNETDDFVKELRERIKILQKIKFEKVYASKVVSLIDNLTYYANKENENRNKALNIVNDEFIDYLVSIDGQYNTFVGTKMKSLYEKNFDLEKNNPTMKEIVAKLSDHETTTIRDLVKNYMHNMSIFHQITDDEDERYNFNAKITFYPLEDKTLILLYGCDLTNYITSLMKSTKPEDATFINKYGLEYYGFWDEMAKPSKITSYVWEERKNDWNKAIPFMENPQNCGLTISIVSNNVFYTSICNEYIHNNVDEIFSYIDNKDARINKTVKKYCKHEFFKRKKIEEKAKWNGDFGYKFIEEKDDEWHELLKTKNKTIMKQIREETSKYEKYMKEITPDDLDKTIINFI